MPVATSLATVAGASGAQLCASSPSGLAEGTALILECVLLSKGKGQESRIPCDGFSAASHFHSFSVAKGKHETNGASMELKSYGCGEELITIYWREWKNN